MRTLQSLVTLSLVATLGTMAGGCFAGGPGSGSNPTPHPGTEDPTGFGASGSANDDGDLPNAPSSEATTDMADAAAGPDPSALDAMIGGNESEDAGPDAEGPSCEAIVDGFDDALTEYQGCETDDDCVLLVDEDDCDCLRALAVSDLEGAEALLDLALSCVSYEDEVLGYCEYDAVALGNTAHCSEGLCRANTPSHPEESCMGFPEEDTEEWAGDTEESGVEDGGPTEDGGEADAD